MVFIYTLELQQGSQYLTKGILKRNEDKIWKFFFRTERKMFHKNIIIFII